MIKERYARIATSLVAVGPARIRAAEPDQPPLFEQVIPRDAPTVDVVVDDEGSREHFTQGA